MKNKKLLTGIIVNIIIVALIIYFTLPAFNFRSVGFYILILSCILLPLIYLINNHYQNKRKSDTRDYIERKTIDKITGKIITVRQPIDQYYGFEAVIGRACSIIAISFIGLMIVFSLSGAKIINAKAYYNQLQPTMGTMEDLESNFEYPSDNVTLPVIDKDLAFKLAQARLSEYGSQYTIDYNNFTLISVERNGKTELVRIAPLGYSNLFVSLTRMNKGSIGYIEVNVVTKEAKLVKVDEGIKYMPSGKFGKDLQRHIRFNNLTELYDEVYFEIDDEGKPFWVIPTYKKQIGVFSGAMPSGTIILNPTNGDIQKYDLGEEPSWVDRCVNLNVVQEQALNHLKYKNGYLNAEIGSRKEVFMLSDGYNYFIKDGQTYFVSCITSPNDNDQTSIGFVAINLKTKETTIYNVDGITEMRAREIAEMDERVKAQELTATWPILINIDSTPTYFIVLKNDVQSQKFVLMDAKTGNKVAMGNTLEEARKEYLRLIIQQGGSTDSSITETVIVDRIRDKGEYIEFAVLGKENYFTVDITVGLDARFLQPGDEIEISYRNLGEYNIVEKLTRK